MRSDHVAEQGLVGAALESVVPGSLLVGPADRQVVDTRNFVVDDGGVTHAGPDDPIATRMQGVEQMLKMRAIEHCRIGHQGIPIETSQVTKYTSQGIEFAPNAV